MKRYPDWFDHHPYQDRLIQRFNRNATFIVGKDDPLIRPLFELIDMLDKPSAMAFALQLCKKTYQNVFKDTYYDSTITEAICNGQAWLDHRIKMPQMRPIILHIHALAKKESDPLLVRHLHAIGQALSTYHCQDHIKGWYLYTLSAWFYQDPYHFDIIAWINHHGESIIAFTNHH